MLPQKFLQLLLQNLESLLDVTANRGIGVDLDLRVEMAVDPLESRIFNDCIRSVGLR